MIFTDAFFQLLLSLFGLFVVFTGLFYWMLGPICRAIYGSDPRDH